MRKEKFYRYPSRLYIYRKEIFWTLLTFGYLLLIYSNSLRSAQESSLQSQGLLRQIERLFPAAIYRLGLTEHVLRKMAHFSEYLILGLLLAQTVKIYGFFLSHQLWMTPLAGFLMAVADEGIQLFSEGRSAQFSDVMLDLCGVTAGMLIWRLIFALREGR